MSHWPSSHCVSSACTACQQGWVGWIQRSHLPISSPSHYPRAWYPSSYHLHRGEFVYDVLQWLQNSSILYAKKPVHTKIMINYYHLAPSLMLIHHVSWRLSINSLTTCLSKSCLRRVLEFIVVKEFVLSMPFKANQSVWITALRS